MRKLTKANEINIGNKLISAYLCRSFFSDRYEARANDLLYEDYVGLRQCLDTIKAKGTFDKKQLPPIFDDTAYPVADKELLSDLGDPGPLDRQQA